MISTATPQVELKPSGLGRNMQLIRLDEALVELTSKNSRTGLRDRNNFASVSPSSVGPPHCRLPFLLLHMNAHQ